ncbi:hypothetical protein G0Q06_04565 [Puniceicoccales bacterium CK1056]|uniref:PIN domain-containing protein n=1 Tax=Oceanipulchritudo coccoides TaxID=2706888 RepID=A0A6B2M055_9BACT|nr:hypothetical protein [Oceanipulchritudo coccoides]NDV61716.1 hypothetical protein [Oceanipulchritudo coccoides]
MKIFLDANVLFSSANTGSQVSLLVDELARDAQLITSDYALQEALRNLRLKRPTWINEFNRVCDQLEIVHSVDGPMRIRIASKDRAILATAIKNACDYLVAGDKRDLGHLIGKTTGITTVVTPLQMALILEDRYKP